VVVVDGGVQAVPQTALLLLWVAITIPTTATAAAPPISQRLGLRWASRTPAGLPGAREISAAKAWEPTIAADATATIKAFLKSVIFPLSSLLGRKSLFLLPNHPAEVCAISTHPGHFANRLPRRKRSLFVFISRAERL
jgi:hypothetical protein